MKIKSLKNYGIPSCILDIWKEHYPPYLLPVQEEAVRDYGILDCGENKTHPHPALSPQGRGNKEGRMQYAPTRGIDFRVRGNDILGSGNEEGRMQYAPTREKARNDRKGMDSRLRGNDRGNNNLLVIAPPSSGKTFIGEMAAVAQAIHQRKIIYLVPLRSLVEEKYRHFKDLYSNCGIDIAISTRDRREDDHRIIRGNYKMAVMAYEKFNYFLLQYPHFLDDISLVIIDEMQMINAPKWGPLLKEILEQLLQRDLATLKIIALSAFVEEQKALLKWFPAQLLISHKSPVELRRGTVNYHFKPKEIKKYLKENGFFSLQNQIRSIDPIDSIDEKINNYLNTLKENRLIKDNKEGILSPTPNGILIIAKRIKVETYLFLRDWIKGSREIETKAIEQEYDLYGGAVYRLGESFSWLANSLAEIAESEGWGKGREEKSRQGGTQVILSATLSYVVSRDWRALINQDPH